MIFEISFVPLDKKGSLAPYIAKAINIIKKSGLPYQLTAMSTQVEGEWDEIMPLIRQCHDELRKVSKRVLTSIKIDDREGARDRLRGKVRDVNQLLK